MDYSKEIKLKAPSSMAVRVQIAELLSGSPSIAGAAALGVCWRGAGAPGVRWKTGKAADYGTAVFDKLLESGMSWSRLNELAVEAVGLISAGLPTDEEEATAMGNSEAPEGSASTSS